MIIALNLNLIDSLLFFLVQISVPEFQIRLLLRTTELCKAMLPHHLAIVHGVNMLGFSVIEERRLGLLRVLVAVNVVQQRSMLYILIVGILYLVYVRSFSI